MFVGALDADSRHGSSCKVLAAASRVQAIERKDGRGCPEQAELMVDSLHILGTGNVFRSCQAVLLLLQRSRLAAASPLTHPSQPLSIYFEMQVAVEISSSACGRRRLSGLSCCFDEEHSVPRELSRISDT